MNKKWLKRIYRYALYVTAVILQKLIERLPRWAVIQLGKKSGKMCFAVLYRERRKALENLEKFFDKKKARVIAENVFANLGINFMEWLKMPELKRINTDSIFAVSGLENMNNALLKNKGVIMLTAHFGNWEYLAAYFAVKGYKGAVIGRRIYFEMYNKLICGLRSSLGIATLDRDTSTKEMIRMLRKNQILGILPDQDTNKVDGIFIDFLGLPAYTPTGPAALALVTGAEIVPCFIVREGKKHHICIEKPLELVYTGDKSEDIRINTEKWSKVVESYILKYPEQWVWIHRRWRTK